MAETQNPQAEAARRILNQITNTSIDRQVNTLVSKDGINAFLERCSKTTRDALAETGVEE